MSATSLESSDRRALQHAAAGSWARDRRRRPPRVRCGAQAALLVTLGTLGALSTLGALLLIPPLVVLVLGPPLWGVWLLGLVDWLRGTAPAAEARRRRR